MQREMLSSIKTQIKSKLKTLNGQQEEIKVKIWSFWKKKVEMEKK